VTRCWERSKMRPSIAYVMLLAATLSAAVFLFPLGLHPTIPRACRENTLVEHYNQASLENIYLCVSTYIYIHVCIWLCASIPTYTHILFRTSEARRHERAPGQPGLWNNQRICNNEGHDVLCRASLYGTASCTYLCLCTHAYIYIYIYGYIPVSALLVLEVKYTCISLRFPLYLYYMCLYLFIYM